MNTWSRFNINRRLLVLCAAVILLMSTMGVAHQLHGVTGVETSPPALAGPQDGHCG